VHRPNVFQHLSLSIFSFNKEFGEATLEPCSHQDELDDSTFIEDLFAQIEKNTFVPYPRSVITILSPLTSIHQEAKCKTYVKQSGIPE